MRMFEGPQTGRTGALLPRSVAARVQLAAAVILVLLAFAGSAAVRIDAALAEGVDAGVEVTTASATTIAPAPAAPVAADEPFTIGDLAAGRVPQDVQDRFWQAQLDAILAAPCPETAAGGTTVTLYLGADEAWTARLSEASAGRAAACAG